MVSKINKHPHIEITNTPPTCGIKSTYWNNNIVMCIASCILGSILLCSCITTKGPDMSKNIYKFTVKDIENNEISLDKYKGKVLLIVNTASKCGFTPQYQGLQELYEKYKSQGFEVLAFPCNQFANQEPEDSKSIKNFCTLNYGVTFPIFKKIEVNGANAHPLFQYLKNAQSGFITSSIKWNFTKFLINKSGIPIARFAPITSPKQLSSEIEKLLKE